LLERELILELQYVIVCRKSYQTTIPLPLYASRKWSVESLHAILGRTFEMKEYYFKKRGAAAGSFLIKPITK
jgi:hypothetical protein